MNTFIDYKKQTSDTGTVVEVAHAWARITGLPDLMLNEIVVFENDTLGQIIALRDGSVDCIIFSNNPLKTGMKVVQTHSQPTIKLSPEILGATIDPLGVSLGEPVSGGKEFPIFHTPAGIPARSRIHRACFTGVKVVDLLLPLGKGQRELVIGDRKTGKTNFLLQSMRFQMQDGAIGIYAAIGKKKTDIKKVQAFFHAHGLSKKSVIVASPSDAPTGMIFLTPYTAMAVAEYFRDMGKDVILILDDLTTHARFYREISLIANRFPGRNSYPSDIFSVHATLLERAGNFKMRDGSDASITCLPVVETLQGDMSGFIQTNIMSMTDGHLLFDGELFAKNRRPALNPFLSVTRVGKQTQDSLQREITTTVLTFLSTVERLQGYTHFGAELHEEARNTLMKGDAVLAYFNQESQTVIDQYLAIFSFAQIWNTNWKDASDIQPFLTELEERYSTDAAFHENVYLTVSESESLDELLKRSKEFMKGTSK